MSGALNPDLWKIFLIHEGDQSNMFEVLERTQDLAPLDWKDARLPNDIRPDEVIQYEVIVNRLERILNPLVGKPKNMICSLNLTENRYARFVLETSNFAEIKEYDLKLLTLFGSLLCLHVTEKTFPAFHAVYLGLWNLCLNDEIRKDIAKATLRMLSHENYRAPIFKLLMERINLLKLYDHNIMFGEPKVKEEIWFHNYNYLIHVARTIKLERYLEPSISSTISSTTPSSCSSSQVPAGRSHRNYEIERRNYQIGNPAHIPDSRMSEMSHPIQSRTKPNVWH